MTEMTDEQIKNWRTVLCQMLGPWALIMPREDVIKIRDKMQKNVNEIDQQMTMEREACTAAKKSVAKKPEPRQHAKEPKVDDSMARIWKRKLDQR